MRNREIVRKWYYGDGDYSKKYKSLFIEDGVLYSYGKHYPLARFYKGQVLINSKRYSVTTSRHKSLVKQIASKFIELPYIFWRSQDEIKENIEYLQKEHPSERSLIEDLKQQYIIEAIK